MVLWNLSDDGLSHSGPLLGPSEVMQGGTPGTNLIMGVSGIRP
jgi:hypothetical protein